MKIKPNVLIAMHVSSICFILFWLVGWTPLLLLPLLVFAYVGWKGVKSRD